MPVDAAATGAIKRMARDRMMQARLQQEMAGAQAGPANQAAGQAPQMAALQGRMGQMAAQQQKQGRLAQLAPAAAAGPPMAAPALAAPPMAAPMAAPPAAAGPAAGPPPEMLRMVQDRLMAARMKQRRRQGPAGRGGGGVPAPTA